ncbi:hypothetical protein ATCVMN08101_237L [Acanthocystis turfacea Chlorella virus MN0810.1]|nr:hypothetical protein ATCVMN08101_237L [Acanthocystis turfacea Chlorella virus MN0810.1]
MSLDSPCPVVVGLAVGKVGLASNRGGHHDEVSAEECEDTRGLGKPLVPANQHTNLAKLGVNHAELVVARAEVELLVVAGPLGDVRLAVGAHDGAVNVRDRDRVIVFVAVFFKVGNNDDHAELAREVREPGHDPGLLVSLRVVKPLAGLLLTEVLHTKELGENNDFGTVGRRVPCHALGGPRVLVCKTRHRELEDGDGGGSHC